MAISGSLYTACNYLDKKYDSLKILLQCFIFGVGLGLLFVLGFVFNVLIVSIISFFSGHLPVFFQREKLVFPSHFIWGFCLAFSYPLIKNYIGKHSNVFNVLC